MFANMTFTDVLGLILFAALIFAYTFRTFGFGTDFLAHTGLIFKRQYDNAVQTLNTGFEFCVALYALCRVSCGVVLDLLRENLVRIGGLCGKPLTFLAPTCRFLKTNQGLIVRLVLDPRARAVFFLSHAAPSAVNRSVRGNWWLRHNSRWVRAAYQVYVFPCFEAVVNSWLGSMMLADCFAGTRFCWRVVGWLRKLMPSTPRMIRDFFVYFELNTSKIKEDLRDFFRFFPLQSKVEAATEQELTQNAVADIEATVANNELENEIGLISTEKKREKRETLKRESTPPPSFVISPALRRYMKQRVLEQEARKAAIPTHQLVTNAGLPVFAPLTEQSVFGPTAAEVQRQLIERLPAEMKDANGGIAFAVARCSDGTYLVERPGFPAMALDLVQQKYFLLGPSSS